MSNQNDEFRRRLLRSLHLQPLGNQNPLQPLGNQNPLQQIPPMFRQPQNVNGDSLIRNDLYRQEELFQRNLRE